MIQKTTYTCGCTELVAVKKTWAGYIAKDGGSLNEDYCVKHDEPKETMEILNTDVATAYRVGVA